MDWQLQFSLDFISHNQSNFHIIPYFYEIGETKIRNEFME